MVQIAEDGPKCCFDLAKSIILSRKTYAIIVKMKSVPLIGLKIFWWELYKQTIHFMETNLYEFVAIANVHKCCHL